MLLCPRSRTFCPQPSMDGKISSNHCFLENSKPGMANFLSPPLSDSFPSTLPREDATASVIGTGGATDGTAASQTVALDLPEWV